MEKEFAWKSLMTDVRGIVYRTDVRGYGVNFYHFRMIELKTGFNFNCTSMADAFNKAFELTGTPCELKCDYGEESVCPQYLM